MLLCSRSQMTSPALSGNFFCSLFDLSEGLSTLAKRVAARVESFTFSKEMYTVGLLDSKVTPPLISHDCIVCAETLLAIRDSSKHTNFNALMLNTSSHHRSMNQFIALIERGNRVQTPLACRFCENAVNASSAVCDSIYLPPS